MISLAPKIPRVNDAPHHAARLAISQGQLIAKLIVLCAVCAAGVNGQEPASVWQTLLVRPDHVDAVFVKVLAKTGDTSRPRVVIPPAAWSLLPAFAKLKARRDSTLEVTTLWSGNGQLRRQRANWTHDDRSRERWLTGLWTKRADGDLSGSLLVLARRRDEKNLFEVRVVRKDHPAHAVALKACAFEEDAAGGSFAIMHSPNLRVPLARSRAMTKFLPEFDKIKAAGFTKTLRAGSTGIGYTLETLLGLRENNDPRGDFDGMEVKAYRDSEAALDDAEKMNLFLKEPKWLDGMRSAERIAAYGYVDDNGRTALYSTVTIRENSHGFRFEIDTTERRLYLAFKGKRAGYWTFDVLQKRLTEKHTEAAFIAADTRGKGRDEEFLYHTVTWCSQPSVDALLRLIRTRDVMLELRMHVKENGAARNHGSAFRVHKNKLSQLYATTIRIGSRLGGVVLNPHQLRPRALFDVEESVVQRVLPVKAPSTEEQCDDYAEQEAANSRHVQPREPDRHPDWKAGSHESNETGRETHQHNRHPREQANLSWLVYFGWRFVG